ncbi:hypothetical protein GCM10010277_24720 [Streptomyces longisporoflavus]|uniref:hypothetical protein n=1 Tax=Streptomyces longisporoflavus TaxID=28044 RepID=UPI00167DC5DE|nr:hypothetical protein [Streptomyces longisporoflavus]GGV37925.1 hypothetical protein GCM10010277_24720 [Streptomyces longisporoflavus]
MAAESFSAAEDITGNGEPLVTTSVHWGTAQLGAPPRHQPAPWQQPVDQETAGAPAVVPDEAPPEWPPHVADQGPPEQKEPDIDDDAVEELIRVAVVSRPLDDVVDLVTLLEQSPEGMPSAASVLRLACVARSVDDVTRLVDLLGPPEHPAEHIDEAIRHAAEERPIPEVSRLVHLLSRPPHDPHSGAEAVHAAGTTRSVEELMQLIGRLSDRKDADSTEAVARAQNQAQAQAQAPAAPTVPPVAAAAQSSVPGAAVTRAQGGTALAWLRLAAGVLLLLCAAAHFPLNWSDASTFGLVAAFCVFGVCALAGLGLCFSRSPAVAVVGVLVAGVLTVSHLVGDRVDSTTLAYVLRPDGVSAPLPALSAAAATLAALLVVALTVAGLRAAANRRPVQGG